MSPMPSLDVQESDYGAKARGQKVTAQTAPVTFPPLSQKANKINVLRQIVAYKSVSFPPENTTLVKHTKSSE